MNNSRIPKNVLGNKILRWKNNPRRDSSLPLNVRGWMRLAGEGTFGGALLKASGHDARRRAIEKEEKEKNFTLLMRLLNVARYDDGLAM